MMGSDVEERDFVDRLGAVLEHAGLPPMAGRILGRLLICEPSEQSSSDLAEYLLASRGAISTSTRLLMEAGLVERVRRPGSRATWFRVREGAWGEMLHAEVKRARLLRTIAEDGLALLRGAPPSQTRRLEEFCSFNRFFERELPTLVERWDEEKSRESG